MSSGRENRELDILVFKEVLDNVACVDRVLTSPGGSLLLAGQSGVGRRTAVTVVAHMHQMQLFTPKISRSYGDKQFRSDLKQVQKITFFFNLISKGGSYKILLKDIFMKCLQYLKHKSVSLLW